MTREIPRSRSDEEHQAFVDGKRAKRMASVDDMDDATRKLVHDYGLNVVRNCMNVGLREPRHIRHLVETILDEFSPTRGTFSNQGKTVVLLDAEVKQ